MANNRIKRKSMVDDYAMWQNKFINLVNNINGIGLEKIKLSLPANDLIRLNLGDPLVFIPIHDEKHFDQDEHIMNLKEFPKA